MPRPANAEPRGLTVGPLHDIPAHPAAAVNRPGSPGLGAVEASAGVAPEADKGVLGVPRIRSPLFKVSVICDLWSIVIFACNRLFGSLGKTRVRTWWWARASLHCFLVFCDL